LCTSFSDKKKVVGVFVRFFVRRFVVEQPIIYILQQIQSEISYQKTNQIKKIFDQLKNEIKIKTSANR
jgi:hypothetical protein